MAPSIFIRFGSVYRKGLYVEKSVFSDVGYLVLSCNLIRRLWMREVLATILSPIPAHPSLHYRTRLGPNRKRL